MTPIIHKMASIRNDNLLVLCLNPDLSIHNDYRLNYLREKYSIQVDYIYRFKSGKIKTWFMGLLICNRNIIQNGVLINLVKWVFWLLSKIIRLMIDKGKYQEMVENNFNQNWARDLLEKCKPNLLIFDWIKRYQHNSGVIMDAAKEKGIPLVALPHGINLITSKFHTNKEEKQGHPNFDVKSFSDFDYFFISNEIEKEHRIIRGLDKKTAITLGSARFSKEWIRINNSIIPRVINEKKMKDSKLKVVFMEHSNHYRANVKEIKKSIDAISKLENINLFVKAHTRSNRFFNDYANVELAKKEITSTELCEWADIVIVTMSSIAIEPLLKDKVLIYPEYFHRNKTLWGDLDACWKINNQSELIEAMYKLKDNPKFKPYSQKNVEYFLDQAIYNGDRTLDILQGYSNFILNLTNE